MSKYISYNVTYEQLEEIFEYKLSTNNKIASEKLSKFIGLIHHLGTLGSNLEDISFFADSNKLLEKLTYYRKLQGAYGIQIQSLLNIYEDSNTEITMQLPSEAKPKTILSNEDKIKTYSAILEHIHEFMTNTKKNYAEYLKTPFYIYYFKKRTNFLWSDVSMTGDLYCPVLDKEIADKLNQGLCEILNIDYNKHKNNFDFFSDIYQQYIQEKTLRSQTLSEDQIVDNMFRWIAERDAVKGSTYNKLNKVMT